MQYNQIYRKLLRREEYGYERDRRHELYYYCSENELYRLCPDLYDTEKREREAEIDLCMRIAVNLALQDLETINQRWYTLIMEFYFDESSTKTSLGKKYGVTRQAILKTLNKALAVLRVRANEHLNRLLNE